MASPQQGDLRLLVLPQIRVQVEKFKPVTEGALQISGQVRYPLCYHGLEERERDGETNGKGRGRKEREGEEIIQYDEDAKSLLSLQRNKCASRHKHK
ncbi:hypothetical protein PoB_000810200 [Plakobranchus ocellatus]|uniref:Uncharacterized protein n=1 Tax=Plakobranchus ocellatus TaxID=259542 RepID=A0AAV3YGN6_9GAST|nr:hypothetical protein PoB_000810200 [Plakobranchus ocellatus]